MSRSPPPAPSAHAKLRMCQRAGPDVGPLRDAWESSTPVSIDYRDYTTAKYNAQHDVILLERNGLITTVLHAAYEQFTQATQ